MRGKQPTSGISSTPVILAVLLPVVSESQAAGLPAEDRRVWGAPGNRLEESGLLLLDVLLGGQT